MLNETVAARAEILFEALPFIQRYRGQLFVIKYGGSAMEDEHMIERLLRDVIFLEAVGINPVLIHGGGKEITNRMRKEGLKPRFVDGLRVTDENSIRLVEDTLDRQINPKIVQRLNELGGKAVGLSGRNVFTARKMPPQIEEKKTVDLGFVGEVVQVHLDEVQQIVSQEKVPVISPLGQDESGVALNVNADVAAGTIASALKAAKLIFLSDVLGVMRDPKEEESLIPTIPRKMIDKLFEDEIIEGGMVPKVKAGVEAISNGVGKVHLIDGRIPHSLLLEVFTSSGVGTEIVA
jgi:acetylglutamate kinase